VVNFADLVTMASSRSSRQPSKFYQYFPFCSYTTRPLLSTHGSLDKFNGAFEKIGCQFYFCTKKHLFLVFPQTSRPEIHTSRTWWRGCTSSSREMWACSDPTCSTTSSCGQGRPCTSLPMRYTRTSMEVSESHALSYTVKT
jgi:hypothetical protein